MENNSIQNFITFLENTLIPDLKLSGRIFTARDMQHAVKFMRGAKRVAGKGRKEFLDYLEMVEKDFIESGCDCTAQDYFTARMFIYWNR